MPFVRTLSARRHRAQLADRAHAHSADGIYLSRIEWLYGFGDRFRIFYVDFDTLERTPKLSAEWLREAAEQNAVI